MSFELTPGNLQAISVRCVSAFMTKQASLVEAISKEAQSLELNSDQVKRVIESTNTLAYLRQLEDATDRTFEFPVADYNGVMSHMCLPEKRAEEEKDEKEEKEDSKEDKKEDSKEEKDKDSKESGNVPPWMENQEKKAMLLKEAMRCKQTLEKIAEYKADVYLELTTTANLISKDPLALEKIAYIVPIEDATKMNALCGITKTAQENVILTNKELEQVNKLYNLYKEAKELVVQEAETQEFVKRAEAVLMDKEAFIARALGRGVGWLGRKAANVIGGVGASAANNVREMFNDSKDFGTAAKGLGFKSTSQGAKAFDNMAKAKGMDTAVNNFGGHKPLNLGKKSMTALTFASGTSLTHDNNVWDSLQGPGSKI